MTQRPLFSCLEYIHVIPSPPVHDPFDVIFSRRILRGVTEVYLPLLWFEEEAVMPHSLAWQLKALLVIMNTPIINIIFGLVAALGLIGATLVLLYRHRAAKKSRDAATKL